MRIRPGHSTVKARMYTHHALVSHHNASHCPRKSGWAEKKGRCIKAGRGRGRSDQCNEKFDGGVLDGAQQVSTCESMG